MDGVAADTTVQLLSGDPRTLVSFDGLCLLLQLCKVSRTWSRQFSCRDVDTWKTALAYVRRHTRTTGAGSLHGVPLLPSEQAVASDAAAASTDAARAGVYKRAVITFALYRLVNGPTVHLAPTVSDSFIHPVWVEAKLETYMSRKNGSETNVIKEITDYWKGLRRTRPVPPVPADLVVRLLYFMKQCILLRYERAPHLRPRHTDLSRLVARIRGTREWY